MAASTITRHSSTDDKAAESVVLFRPLLETYAERYRLPRTLVKQYPHIVVILRDKINSDATIELLKRENEQLRKQLEKVQNVRPPGER